MGTSMATKSENSDIAVLQTQMQAALDVLAAIQKKLDTQDDKFVPRTEFEEFKRRWALSHLLTAIISGAFVGLVVYFFTHGG